MEISKTMRVVLDALHEGINIIDGQGRIVFANRAYLDFLRKEVGREIGPIEGMPLRDLRPGARLPDVLIEGKPILHLVRHETQDDYFVNMYPLYQGGMLIGGLSVVTFMEDACRTREALEAVEVRNRQLLRRINKANGAKYVFADIIGVSPISLETKALAEKIASADVTVLLEGESGTGKELYAQAIHHGSPRQDEVFVAVNCANFNSNTLESELFGYVEGAFTGAKKGGKMGLFEAAGGGTLFLDEISEMDLSVQSKLLRALQERCIRPLGGVKEIHVDVRVIAACNVPLAVQMEKGKFRKDLYYRLNTFPLRIPALRERPEDIPALISAILSELSQKLRRELSLSQETLLALCHHDWPGNVRELRNVLEFSAYLSSGSTIQINALPANLFKDHRTSHSLAEQVRHFEQEVILRSLQANGSDLAGKRKTAEALGISLATLYSKLK